MEIESDRVKEYAKKKIEHIKFIQESLDELKKCEYFQKKFDGSQQDDLPKLIARANSLLVLSTTINLLQELIGFYEKVTNKITEEGNNGIQS